MQQNNPQQDEIRPLAVHKRPKVSYYVTAGIFSLGVLYFFSARLVEIIDSSFISPFNFAILVVGYLAVGSLFITPPKTMALTVRRIGLIIIVSFFVQLLDLPFLLLLLSSFCFSSNQSWIRSCARISHLVILLVM